MNLPRSTPSEQGVDADGITRFLDAVAAQDIELHSVMLLRHGHVVAEGWWAPYGPQQVHLLYSLSKSFTSTAIGLAVEEGLLSVEDKVVSFFPDAVPADPSPHLLDMRVHHLLCMGTGHNEDTTRQVFYSGLPPIEAFFRIPPDQPPGEVFAYNSTATYVLSKILTTVSGQRLTEYLRPRLFDPLGIEQVYTHMVDGADMGFSGLHVTTESIARLGQLYLRRGEWNGRQILPESWVAAATSRQIDTVTPWRQSEPVDWQQGYGYQFWRCTHNAFRGDGAHGQFCVVVPEADLVLATTAATSDMQAILTAAWTHLLPALGAGTGDEAALRERLGAPALPTLDGAGPGGKAVTFTSAVPAEERERYPRYESVAFTPAANGWTLQIGDELQIACGHGEWAADTLAVPGSPPIFSCAAWTSPDTLEAQLIVIDTPHRLHLRCDAASGTFTLGWNIEPLRDPTFEGLAAHRLN